MVDKNDDVINLINLAEKRFSTLKDEVANSGTDSRDFRLAVSMLIVPLKMIDEINYKT